LAKVCEKKKKKFYSIYCCPGDLMITIFDDLHINILGKTIGILLGNQCYDKHLPLKEVF
jgi:hypothetical protein